MMIGQRPDGVSRDLAAFVYMGSPGQMHDAETNNQVKLDMPWHPDVVRLGLRRSSCKLMSVIDLVELVGSCWRLWQPITSHFRCLILVQMSNIGNWAGGTLKAINSGQSYRRDCVESSLSRQQ